MELIIKGKSAKDAKVIKSLMKQAANSNLEAVIKGDKVAPEVTEDKNQPKPKATKAVIKKK